MVLSSQIFRRKKWRGDYKIPSCLQSRKQLLFSIFHFSCLTLYYIWIVWRVWFWKDRMCCLRIGKFFILRPQDKCLGYWFFCLMRLYLFKHLELNEGPLDQFSHDMEPFLRIQGMPVRLNRGILMCLWYASSNKFSSDAIYCQLICFVCIGYCFGLSSVRM